MLFSTYHFQLFIHFVFSEIVDSLEAIIPEQVSHQIYVKACKKYTYPIKPRVSRIFNFDV